MPKRVGLFDPSAPRAHAPFSLADFLGHSCVTFSAGITVVVYVGVRCINGNGVCGNRRFVFDILEELSRRRCWCGTVAYDEIFFPSLHGVYFTRIGYSLPYQLIGRRIKGKSCNNVRVPLNQSLTGRTYLMHIGAPRNGRFRASEFGVTTSGFGRLLPDRGRPAFVKDCPTPARMRAGIRTHHGLTGRRWTILKGGKREGVPKVVSFGERLWRFGHSRCALK
jgi:hypothetical protein